MANFSFYHLTSSPLTQALPKLLQSAMKGGYRVLLVAQDDATVDQLDQLLWTYDAASFLPHGVAKDGQANMQPVLLSTQLAEDNNANLLVVTDGRSLPDAVTYERVLDIFDGNDGEATKAARARWSAYKNAGHEIAYFSQSASGWEKKA